MNYKLSTPNIGADEIAAASEVLASGNLVYGTVGREFENALENYIGVDAVRVVSSGTAALYIALKALKVGPGKAVIVPGLTFPATVNAVLELGARPVICDVEADTYSIDISALENCIDTWNGPEELVAVIPVHEFGYPVDMERLCSIAKANGLQVIEDAACALGASSSEKLIGSFGDLACFSFHPRKTLTTGEGGAVAVNNPDLLMDVEHYRNHGISYANGKPEFVTSSLNFRLTDFQSALGLPQLKNLDAVIQTRRGLVDVYVEAFSNHPLITLPKRISGHSWQTFMVVLADNVNRDQVGNVLKKQGIEAGFGAHSLYQLSSLQNLPRSSRQRYVADRLYEQGLAIPFCEKYANADLEFVADQVIKAIEASRS